MEDTMSRNFNMMDAVGLINCNTIEIITNLSYN